MTNNDNTDKKPLLKEIAASDIQSSGGNLKFIASKEIVDRDGDIIYIDGIDTKNFEKNPLFLWGHDSNALPIGKVVSLSKTSGMDGIRQLNIEVEFYKSTQAQEIKDMYANGFLNAVSVRILPKNYELYKDKNNEGYKFIESELLEVSAVNIPANQAALIQKMLDQSMQLKRLEKTVDEMKSVYEKIATITDTLEKFYVGNAEKNLENRITNISKKLLGEK